MTTHSKAVETLVNFRIFVIDGKDVLQEMRNGKWVDIQIQRVVDGPTLTERFAGTQGCNSHTLPASSERAIEEKRSLREVKTEIKIALRPSANLGLPKNTERCRLEIVYEARERLGVKGLMELPGTTDFIKSCTDAKVGLHGILFEILSSEPSMILAEQKHIHIKNLALYHTVLKLIRVHGKPWIDVLPFIHGDVK